MNDFGNPFATSVATSVFLAARETVNSPAGRVLRQTAAGFVFLAAIALVFIATASSIENAASDEAVAAQVSSPTPQYLAAQANVAAQPAGTQAVVAQSDEASYDESYDYDESFEPSGISTREASAR